MLHFFLKTTDVSMTVILCGDCSRTLHHFVGDFVSHFSRLTRGGLFLPKIEIVCHFTVRSASCF